MGRYGVVAGLHGDDDDGLPQPRDWDDVGHHGSCDGEDRRYCDDDAHDDTVVDPWESFDRYPSCFVDDCHSLLLLDGSGAAVGGVDGGDGPILGSDGAESHDDGNQSGVDDEGRGIANANVVHADDIGDRPWCNRSNGVVVIVLVVDFPL